MADKWDKYAEPAAGGDRWAQYAEKPAISPEQTAQLARNDQSIAAREQSPDAGFLPTLWNDISSAPTKAMNFLTGHPVQEGLQMVKDATAARQAQRPLASQALHEGNYGEALGHGLASVMPFVGPMAANIGEEIGGGQPGQGMAHAAELLAPSMAKPAAAMVERAAPIARGALAEAKAAAMAPASMKLRGLPVELPVNATVAGGAAGASLGGTVGHAVGMGEPGAVVGGAIGAAAPAVRGAFRGGMNAYKASQAVEAAPMARVPIWANNPAAAPREIPDVEPIHQPLPSGRMQWPAPAEQPQAAVPNATGNVPPATETAPPVPRPMAQPAPASAPTLPRGGVLPKLQEISDKADALGYERPAPRQPDYTPPKAERIASPEAVKPDSRVIAQQLADEMRRSGTLPPEDTPAPEVPGLGELKPPKVKAAPMNESAKPVAPYAPKMVTHGMNTYDSNLWEMAPSGEQMNFGKPSMQYSRQLRADTTSPETRAVFEEMNDPHFRQKWGVFASERLSGLRKRFDKLLDADRAALGPKEMKK